ncbi:tape measure protein [Vibrio phage CKB-S1]|nr:tape measure protein [Vibrio phage CKB-S1]
MSRPIRNIQRRLERFTRSGVRNMRKLRRATDGVTKSMASAGKTAAGAVVTIATALGAASVAGVEFEHTMNRATTKMPGNVRKGTEEFQGLVDAAKHVGATTQFSATQAAEGLDFLAMAGFNAKQAMAALPGVVDLAVVSGVDLGTATDIATDSLGAFNLMTKDSAQLQTNLSRVNDVLAKTTTRANTTIEQMFEALVKGGPVATAAGASIEETAALIGVMANAGIKGEVAGTGLKNIFLAMSAPTSEAAKVFRRLGVDTVDSTGKVRSAISVFEDMRTAMKGMGQAQQLAIMDAIFGKIPIAQAINLLNAAGGEVQELKADLDAASGAAKQMATQIGDDTLGSLNTLRSTIESVSIRFFELSGESIRGVIDRTTELIGKNREFIAQNLAGFLNGIIENIDQIVRGIKLFATVFAVLWTFNTIVKTLTGAMTLFNLVVAANPIVLAVTAAVVAVAALAAAIYYYWNPIKKFFSELWEGVEAAFTIAFNNLKAAFDAVFGPIRDAITWALEKIDSLLGAGDGATTVVPPGQGAFAIAGQAGGVLPTGPSPDSPFALAGRRGGLPPAGSNTTPDVVTPEERQAQVFREQLQKNIVELRINDPDNRVEVGGQTDKKDNVTVTKTGSF